MLNVGSVMLVPFFELQIRDIVDIFLVTSMLYLAIVWIRRKQAALVAGGILVLGALYVGALLLDLRLTTWILQGFFAALFIVIVVIFQEEIRQLFERLAVWSLRRRETDFRSSPADVLTRCLADFARDRIGALVVLTGRQPLARHLDGGIELDGRLSIPLLKSLFDPHSPGHDGAVLVAGDRIKRFAIQLPLSKKSHELTGLGTRHSAALGLAELSDAMCIVVSEERGTISIARDGRLHRAISSQEVGRVIDEFIRPPQPPEHSHSAMRLLRENWLEKAISLVIVASLWYALVPGSRNVENRYSVPVTIENLPQDLTLEGVDPPSIEVSLRGPARAFYIFDSKRLAVHVDVTLAQLGRRTFPVSKEDLRHPPQLTIEQMEPSTVKLRVKKNNGKNATEPAAVDQK